MYYIHSRSCRIWILHPNQLMGIMHYQFTLSSPNHSKHQSRDSFKWKFILSRLYNAVAYPLRYRKQTNWAKEGMSERIKGAMGGFPLGKIDFNTLRGLMLYLISEYSRLSLARTPRDHQNVYVLSGVRTNQSILYVLLYVGDLKCVLLIRSYVSIRVRTN